MSLDTKVFEHMISSLTGSPGREKHDHIDTTAIKNIGSSLIRFQIGGETHVALMKTNQQYPEHKFSKKKL